MLLFSHQADLDPLVDGRPTRESDNDGEARVARALKIRAACPRVNHLELLFGPYEPEFYYWEVIETVRRLLATSVLLLVPSTMLRIIVSILLSMLTLKLYGYFEPYTDRSDDILAEALQWITCLIMLTLLLTMTNADNVQYYMIALQLIAVLVIFVLLVSDIGRERRAFQRLYSEIGEITESVRKSISPKSNWSAPSAPSRKHRGQRMSHEANFADLNP